ncbi:MAG: T9SS type A sorting domain-containing protein [Candidatus Azobacteroides sp.]|nr:T9SS type A sorting domain-containing protein [Candidatus Azobacteroides sp.]
MRKLISLSIALIAAGFFAAVAQNNFTAQERLLRPNARFEYPNFEKLKLQTSKKTNPVSEWWVPDTVYVFSNDHGTEMVERNIFEYNSQGLLAVNIGQSWRNDSWENVFLVAYTYDSNSNILTCLQQRWGNNSWVDSYLFTYTYDSNNNMLTESDQIWRGTFWVNSSLYTYTYDSDNNMLTCLYEYGDSFQLETYTYDSNHNALTFLRQYGYGQNNSWQNISTFTYTYDSNNNMLTGLQQSWQNNSWQNISAQTYTYDSDNKVLNELRQSWENNSWVNSNQDTCTYDSGNNLLTKLYQGWRNNSWADGYLFTYTYDSNHNLLTELYQSRENNSWVNYRRTLMIYDENGNGISAERWWWVNESWQPPLYANTERLSLYYNNMQSVFECVDCDKITASYIKVSDLNTSVEPVAIPESDAASIYPNPTTGELRIKNYESGIKDIQIFDLAGNKLPLRMETGRDAVDISHLSPGMYFIQITTEKGVVTKKIVKI